MSTTIAATVRPAGTKGHARKLRAMGQMPAVMYGPDSEPTAIAIGAEALTKIFRRTRDRNTVVEIEIDGKTHPTLVREVQRHPVSRNILHADFYKVSKERKVEVMVPIVGDGKPAGAILGGRMRLIRRVVKVRSDYDKIPKQLTIDVSPMNIGDMVLASEIPLPDGVELVFDHDFNVLTVYGKKAAPKKEAEPVVGGAPAAEPEAEE